MKAISSISIAIFIAFCLLFAVSTALPAHAQTIYTATPVADTNIRSQFPNTNYGLTTISFVRATPSSRIRKSYIDFYIPERTLVTSSTLFVYWYDPVSIDVLATYSGWDEGTINWNTAPPDIGYIQTLTMTNGWNAIDVSGAIRNGYAIAFTSNYTTDSSLFSFATRESALSPYIAYQLAPIPTPVPGTAAAASTQNIPLPSGAEAVVTMSATAGELFISGLLLLIFFVFIWQAIERLANFNAKR